MKMINKKNKWDLALIIIAEVCIIICLIIVEFWTEYIFHSIMISIVVWFLFFLRSRNSMFNNKIEYLPKTYFGLRIFFDEFQYMIDDVYDVEEFQWYQKRSTYACKLHHEYELDGKVFDKCIFEFQKNMPKFMFDPETEEIYRGGYWLEVHDYIRMFVRVKGWLYRVRDKFIKVPVFEVLYVKERDLSW